ncbi:MAG TPA: hypothetical protein VFW87_18510 [Pirellulales bacterium]|nr:hypothetical protein [Pirellulales bacterium]
MANPDVRKLEARTRVVFNLPVSSTGETKALYEVIDYVQRLKDRRIGVTGFTFSEPTPAVFTGFWWSDEQSVWMEDGIVIMMIDFAMPSAGGKWSVSGEMTKLKRFITTAYRRYGSQQEEVWVVAHRVSRQT